MSKNSTNRRIVLPKHFTSGSIVAFITQCQAIFDLKNKREEGFVLDATKVEQTTILGVLLLYKFMEYTRNNGCFQNPTIWIYPESPMAVAIRKYGFAELIIDNMIKTKESDPNKILKEYKKLKVSKGENFIIAPQALLRSDKNSREEINKHYLPQIEEYYKTNPKAVSMILLTFSEILLNFWEHAVTDSKSIIVASGNKDQIEIACADTGEGIIATLTSNPKYSNLISKPEYVIKKSVQKNVTSKENTNHMGYGLWILDKITSLVNGRFHIFSQGIYYNNDIGKIKTGKCGYWKGTIIYLSLPLKDPKTLEDIHEINPKTNLQINWT